MTRKHKSKNRTAIIGDENRLGIFVTPMIGGQNVSLILNNVKLTSLSTDESSPDTLSVGYSEKEVVKVTLEMDIKRKDMKVMATSTVEDFKRHMHNIPKHIPDKQLDKYNKAKKKK